MALTPPTGGEAPSGAAPPAPPVPRPSQPAAIPETPFAEPSGMTLVGVNKTLTELVQWQAQHPELSFALALSVTMEGASVDEATLASLNEWPRQKRVNLKFEK